jgi:hypothetical protein
MTMEMMAKRAGATRLNVRPAIIIDDLHSNSLRAELN